MNLPLIALLSSVATQSLPTQPDQTTVERFVLTQRGLERVNSALNELRNISATEVGERDLTPLADFVSARLLTPLGSNSIFPFGAAFLEFDLATPALVYKLTGDRDGTPTRSPVSRSEALAAACFCRNVIQKDFSHLRRRYYSEQPRTSSPKHPCSAAVHFSAGARQ
jgi:hypothetical protein